ncbi:DUF2793 domain-containing protein [Salipiger mucosus]|uniref:DUF2793 domain-containing protein n=1 Tax=Salipiger mucosus DSM 16094 TaxID=1123237 RepID=S9Q706_9RHOB|nr:DUF2793 domain-containing protein [Salipiger mucosus]EPX75423.1 hypothetical protein Salmuc_04765 [Salipiger mucosus DSM 16094]
MADDRSPILSLPYLQPAQAQKHVTHNEALRLLDVAVQLAVADRDRTDPPSGPAPGDRHIAAPGATGAWAGQDGTVALWTGSAWEFFAPLPGWRARVLSEGLEVVFDGSAWAPAVGFDNLAGVGINASADATNRLAVSAPATLLGHEGAGHRLVIDKAGPAETASLLFQTGWSGRAEMGTAGNDDFSIKLSPDGASWTTALRLDAGGGASGAAVQQGPQDVTPGRLARADLVYGPGNLLGPVSQQAGQPAGAVIERGSNANGDYVRFADGTQICTGTVDYAGISCSYGYAGGYRSTAGPSVGFAAAFAADPRVIVCPDDIGDSDALVAGVVVSQPTHFSVRLFRVTSGTADFRGGFLAIGTWT